MRIFFLSISFVFFIFAKEVNIKANKFYANKKENKAIFTGQVSMIKGDDTLVCEKLVVYTKEDNNQTTAYKYIATGNVAFTLKKKDGLIIGNGDKVIYDLDNKKYTIIGNGYLENTAKKSVVKGDKIFVDEVSEDTKIEGKKDKPIEFKFKIKDK